MFRLTIVLSALIACALSARVPNGLIPRPRLDGRIVGGEDANIKDYPHQISMRYYGSHRCGGTIIKNNVILTAAHCVAGIKPGSLQIVAGATKLSDKGQIVDVAQIFVHGQYRNFDYDLAILKLSTELELGETVDTLALPETEPEAGEEVEITGWGSVREGGNVWETLQVVKVPIVDRKECVEAYKYMNEITKNMFCAGYTQGGKDACQGDSGGPVKLGNTVVGAVSWGYGCARPNYPGVYSNVHSMIDFVNDVLGKL